MAKQKDLTPKAPKHHKRLLGTGSRLNRKASGDVFMLVVVGLMAAFSFFPLLMAVSMSLKPIHELFYYPPKLLAENPTLDNFRMLLGLMQNTRVSFFRYAFNTVFISLAVTIGHVFLASLCAYPLAKLKIPGINLLNTMVMLSLMFVSAVTDVANYLTISWLGWLDTYRACIIPAMGASLGLFIMRNYISTIPDSLLEAATIDGAQEFTIYWKIIMPLCKPAWITLIILSFQQMWGTTGGVFIYSEELKPVSYVLSQLVSGGIARTGVSSAVSLIMMLVPVAVFVISQSNVIETMSTSGMKD